MVARGGADLLDRGRRSRFRGGEPHRMARGGRLPRDRVVAAAPSRRPAHPDVPPAARRGRHRRARRARRRACRLPSSATQTLDWLARHYRPEATVAAAASPAPSPSCSRRPASSASTAPIPPPSGRPRRSSCRALEQAARDRCRPGAAVRSARRDGANIRRDGGGRRRAGDAGRRSRAGTDWCRRRRRSSPGAARSDSASTDLPGSRSASRRASRPTCSSGRWSRAALLPTVAYLGGPAELRYLALTPPVYQQARRRTASARCPDGRACWSSPGWTACWRSSASTSRSCWTRPAHWRRGWSGRSCPVRRWRRSPRSGPRWKRATARWSERGRHRSHAGASHSRRPAPGARRDPGDREEAGPAPQAAAGDRAGPDQPGADRRAARRQAAGAGPDPGAVPRPLWPGAARRACETRSRRWYAGALEGPSHPVVDSTHVGDRAHPARGAAHPHHGHRRGLADRPGARPAAGGPAADSPGTRDLAKKVDLLEAEVDDLTRSVQALQDENAFLQRLLAESRPRSTLPPPPGPERRRAAAPPGRR